MSMIVRTSLRLHSESVTDRLLRVVDLHFDPVHGSAFWLDRASSLGVDARRSIRTVQDLSILGEVTARDLCQHPLLFYVPRRFHLRLDQLIIGQTAGTTSLSLPAGTGAQRSGPVWTAYETQEFEEAFVLPFVEAAEHLKFPANEQWLYIGPSGPHIIGKAMRHLASAMESPDPFSVDFDPRWIRKLPEGSVAKQRYLDHVVEQALAVIRTQPITVLFTTPPVLDALAPQMSDAQRQRICGVHYGGLPISSVQMHRFQTQLFPRAVQLSGYGNTLMGCCMELSTAPGRPLDYFPLGSRLLLEVVDDQGHVAAAGQAGQLRLTRLDETMLIVRLLERDHAVAVPPPADAPVEFHLPGLRDPGPRLADAPQFSAGLY